MVDLEHSLDEAQGISNAEYYEEIGKYARGKETADWYCAIANGVLVSSPIIVYGVVNSIPNIIRRVNEGYVDLALGDIGALAFLTSFSGVGLFLGIAGITAQRNAERIKENIQKQVKSSQ